MHIQLVYSGVQNKKLSKIRYIIVITMTKQFNIIAVKSKEAKDTDCDVMQIRSKLGQQNNILS